MQKILSDQVGAISIWLEVLLYGKSHPFSLARSKVTRIFRNLLYAVHASFVYCLEEEGKHSTSKGPSHRRFPEFNELICWTRKVFLYATIAMWILSTSHLGLNLYRLLRAYVWLWMTVGPANYFLDRRRWDNFVHDLISMLTTWLANFLLIYRCFLVWNNSFYVIALPAVLLFLNIDPALPCSWLEICARFQMRRGWTAITVVALYLYITDPHRVLSEYPLVHLVDTTYALAFVQIAITTGLIAYRIQSQEVSLKIARIPSMPSQYSRLISAVLIAVESAMFYALVSCLAVILYATKSDAQFLLREAVIPSAGIALVPLMIRSVVCAEGLSSGTRVGGSLSNDLEPSAPNPNDPEFGTAGGANHSAPPIQLKSISQG